jgi:hypothetical protein
MEFEVDGSVKLRRERFKGNKKNIQRDGNTMESLK